MEDKTMTKLDHVSKAKEINNKWPIWKQEAMKVVVHAHWRTRPRSQSGDIVTLKTIIKEK